MTRVLLVSLLLSIACGDDGTSTTVPDPDLGPVADLGQPDMPPTPPTVTVEPIVAAADAELVLPWLFGEGGSPGAAAVLAPKATALRQPAGPDLLDLEGSRIAIGLRAMASDPFEWVAHSNESDVRSLRGDDGEIWTHFSSSEPRGFNDETIGEPTIVRWRDGAIVNRYPVPAGVGLDHLGVDGEGTRWVLGSAPGGTVVGGSPVGAGDESLVLFLAELDDAGLTNARRIAGGALRGAGPESAGLLSNGDVLLVLEVLGDATLFDDSIASEEFLLVRVDPGTGSLVERWSSDGDLRIRPDGDALEIIARLPSSTAGVTIAGVAYEPLPAFEAVGRPSEAVVQIRWDGAGGLPPGERWPADPQSFDGAGVALAGPGSAVNSVLFEVDSEEDYRRYVAFTGTGARHESVRTDDGVALMIVSRDAEAPELFVADASGATQVPLELVSAGSDTLWVLELSPPTWEVVRRRAFDLGPLVDGDRPDAFATPVSPQHILIAVRRSGESVAEVWVEGWAEGSAPAPVPVEVADGCRATLGGMLGIEPRRPTDDDSLVNLIVSCDAGPHVARLDGQGFEHDPAHSSTLYRIRVD